MVCHHFVTVLDKAIPLTQHVFMTEGFAVFQEHDFCLVCPKTEKGEAGEEMTVYSK